MELFGSHSCFNFKKIQIRNGTSIWRLSLENFIAMRLLSSRSIMELVSGNWMCLAILESKEHDFIIGIQCIKVVLVVFFLQPTVSRPVHLGIGPPFGIFDQILSCSSFFV
jgi:hypothetical protein